jgi:hypothetical protein
VWLKKSEDQGDVSIRWLLEAPLQLPLPANATNARTVRMRTPQTSYAITA